jgi:hypothetical protein
MLKTASSFVLASLKRSAYGPNVRLALSLAAASLEVPFEHSVEA